VASKKHQKSQSISQSFEKSAKDGQNGGLNPNPNFINVKIIFKKIKNAAINT